MKRFATVALSFASTLLALACGDDHSHDGERPTCDEIGETCHESTTAAGQECHEKAEDTATTEDECLEMRDACLTECAPAI